MNQFISHRLEYLVFTWSYLTENYKNHRSNNKDVMTSVKPIPNGYRTVTPYILVQGAEKLIDFVKKAFDAKETERYLLSISLLGQT
jgi:hypothetical protein